MTTIPARTGTEPAASDEGRCGALRNAASPWAALVTALILMFSIGGQAEADDAANYQTKDGLAVYLGLMPTAIVAGHPPGHPEASMHGGAPSGTHAYHVVIAVFDEKTGERVENATVTAVVSGLGHVGTTNVAMEPMLIDGTVTYGAFVDLRALARFDVAVTILVPWRDAPVRVDFANEHVP